MSPWVEKHRPINFQKIKGQDNAIETLKNFIETFSPKIKKKAIILHGPPGTGKTTMALVTATETNSEIFELNASDFRNKQKLQENLRPAIEQQSLKYSKKIILIDEADGISGYYDRGGLLELLKLIESSSYPIIITANDIWVQKLSPLRKKCELVEIKQVNQNIIKEIMISILKKENNFIENEILTQIAIKAKGDIRAAINDLQTASKLENPSEIVFDERNKKTDIFNALKLVFQGKPTEETLRIFDTVDMPLDQILLWLEENIPLEYSGLELIKAYEALSRTDIFKGRIYKKQYWRFLVYENIFSSYGISAAKNTPKTNFIKYKKPSRILKIWLNNQRTAKKKSISIKYAKYVHIGTKRAMNEFPIFKQIINSNPKIKNELKLNEEEIEYLRR